MTGSAIGPLPKPEIAADAEAAIVALAHGRVPVRLDLAGLFVVGDSVVDDDVGIGNAADRAVQVMDRRAPLGGAAAEIGRPAALDRREIDRLGVDEFQRPRPSSRCSSRSW